MTRENEVQISFLGLQVSGEFIVSKPYLFNYFWILKTKNYANEILFLIPIVNRWSGINYHSIFGNTVTNGGQSKLQS